MAALIVGAIPNIACDTGSPRRNVLPSSMSSINKLASCNWDTISLIFESILVLSDEVEEEDSLDSDDGTCSHWVLKQSINVVRISLPGIDDMYR